MPWELNELADIPDRFIFISEPMNKKIIVSMTSWKKRINNVPKVVYSILRNKIKPDVIICNLSTEEFPNKEKDLPEELVLLTEGTCFRINWVKENTKTFKKIIPTLQLYKEKDYYLFSIDDDEIYHQDYIETGLKYLKNNDVVVIAKRTPSNNVWGGMTCYNSKIFKENFWTALTNEMIKTTLDDEYINAYLQHYSIKVQCCLEKHTTKFNDIFPNRGNGYSISLRKKAKDIANRIMKTIS